MDAAGGPAACRSRCRRSPAARRSAPSGGNEPGAADASFPKPPPEGPLGASRCALVVGAGVICAAATVAFGVYPDPLVDWASAAGESLGL